jgi:hypothetical protein
MIVRWIRRSLGIGYKGRGYQLSAVLDGCLQEGEGYKPSHLATIEERFLSTKARDMRAFHQGLFWVSVDKNLTNIELKAGERQKIEEQIALTVPRPSSEWALWGVVCVPKYDKQD